MTQQFHSQVYKWKKWKCTHKNLYMKVHSNIICNSQKVGTTKCLLPANGQTKSRNGILFRNEKG